MNGIIKIDEFLRSYPRMNAVPIYDGSMCLEGIIDFSADSEECGLISDSFRLRMVVPETFPNDLPIVYELGGRIPRDRSYHINQYNNSLCLGSRLRLLLTISKRPTLMGFTQNCLIPYLYAVSRKLSLGGCFAFGELPHGTKGEVEDYRLLFCLQTTDQVWKTIDCLSMKKRRANKHPCPCGCGRTLGRCRFNRRIRKFRSLAGRTWLQNVVRDLKRESPTQASLVTTAQKVMACI